MKQFLTLLVLVLLFLTGTAYGQIGFTAKMDGAQESPTPVTTSATGTGTFILNANGTQLTYNITINGITPTAAHFHNAAAGEAGGVVKNLSFVNGTASGVWSSTDAT